MSTLTDKSLGNRTEMADSHAKRLMMKRWAAWPQSTRWLAGGIAAAALVLALVVSWVLFVPVADWLAHHDVGSARGALLQKARDDARARLLTLGAGLVAAGVLLFTARNFILSRRTLQLSEQGQVTDRYTKAIEQLGSKELDVRVGGIYALERIARDFARDHPTVMEVLSAFIREHSREQWPPPDSGEQKPESAADWGKPKRWTRPDVQAALTVIGRREAEHDIPGRPIDLYLADLTHADLRRANLRGAILHGATLVHTDLRGATLIEADLREAMFCKARLDATDLVGASWSSDGATVPDGWKLGTGSDQLTRADTVPNPAA